MGRLFLALVPLALSACAYGQPVSKSFDTHYIVQENTRFAPSKEDTERALYVTVATAGPVFDLTEEQVADALDRVYIIYTSDELDVPHKEGYIVTGYTYGNMVVILCDEIRSHISRTALTHEFAHVLLRVKGSPEPNHDNRWNAAVESWIAESNELLAR